jgi:two-component system, cell cycle response regulator
MHAVVVDSSRVVLKLVSELITEHGNAVTAFHDSASALHAIRSDPTVNVLITSLEVQPMSGLELCWEARTAISTRRPLYIVVMSSRSDDHRLTEALDCGADDLVSKPVSRLELQARLRLAGRLAAAQLRLVQLAETDPLTGLLNRRAFFERLNAVLEGKAKALPLSAILFDIDQFKRINDTYGHDVGDAVIRGIADEAARHAELVGRLGGEEFAIVLREANEAQAFRSAEDLRQACENLSFSADGKPFRVTCSFGISACSEGETADQMLRKADIALYQAKNAGRNRVCAGSGAVPLIPTGQPHGIIRAHPRSPT